MEVLYLQSTAGRCYWAGHDDGVEVVEPAVFVSWFMDIGGSFGLSLTAMQDLGVPKRGAGQHGAPHFKAVYLTTVPARHTQLLRCRGVKLVNVLLDKSAAHPNKFCFCSKAEARHH